MEAYVGECVSWQEARETLRSWREEGVRRSTQTVQLAQVLLADKPSSLGSEGECVMTSGLIILREITV